MTDPATRRLFSDLIQPTEVLDLAWDSFYGREWEKDARKPPYEQPGWGLRLVERGVEPFEISMLFDIAITAYAASLAEGQLGDLEHYRKVYLDGGSPCGVSGCRLSQQEHHRLAYGWMSELRELRAAKRQTEGERADSTGEDMGG